MLPAFSIHLVALAIGFVADLLFGDPHWLPHPIRAIGKLIELAEKGVRAVFPATPSGQRAAGVVLVLVVCAVPTALCCATLWLAFQVSWWFALVLESVICYQMLAVKSLRDESMKVHEALTAGTIEQARYAVSRIVGRDTDALDERGVAKAAVETVPENTSDDVIAPLLFMGIGGAPLGVLYKAVNTMDSMVGYRNDRYRYLGTCAARLDDVLNYIPARLAALLMCIAAAFLRLDAKGAWRIWRRDHARHLSPNAAHTESACAGALGLMLAGDGWYFGKLVEKPTIGDAHRCIGPDDIVRANALLYVTAALGLLVALSVGLLISLIMEVPIWL